jgi:Predicted membrane protein
MKNILDSALIITVLSAILFSSSTDYLHSYLNAFGVETGFIIENIYSLLFSSIFILLKPLLATFLACLVLLAILSIAFEVRRKKKQKRKTTSIYLNKQNQIVERQLKSQSITNPFEQPLSRVYFLFLFVLSFIFLLIYAEHEGKDAAITSIETIKNCNYKSSSLINISSFKNPIYVLTCGDTNCVGVEIDDKNSCQKWLSSTKKLKLVYFENKAIAGGFFNYAN